MASAPQKKSTNEPANARPPEFVVERIDRIDDLRVLRDEWIDLRQRCGSHTIFLDPDWQLAWIDQYLDPSRELFVLAVRRKSKLVGLACWYRARAKAAGLPVRELLPIGTPETASDYLEPLVLPGQHKPVMNALIDHLFGEAASEWDRLRLVDFPAESHAGLHLINRLRLDGKLHEIDEGGFCPVTSLPESFDALMARLSRNRREQYRRHLKLLGKQGEVGHASYRGAEITHESMGPLIEIHRKRWPDREYPYHEFLGRLVTNLAQRDVAQLDYLTLDDVPIAGLLHFDAGGVREMYVMAIDHDLFPQISVGNLLVGKAIEDAIDKGLAFYDFLKGDEGYKFHWADTARRCWTITVPRRCLPLILDWTLRQAKQLARFFLR